jgi:2-dehydro-3-deoxygluconokinase
MITDFHSNKPFQVISFGEVMLRLSPNGTERISLSETFQKRAGGSELNVVSGISQLGLRTGIVTKLPNNQIGQFVKNHIRFSGVSDDFLIFDEDPASRLGIYYYESGAHPRKPIVEYDRTNASITTITIDDIPESIYSSTDVFHVSGITLALDENIRNIVVGMIKRFKEQNTIISFDVNFRASLWSEETARATIESILPYIDVLFISEETCRRMFAQTGTMEEIMKSYATKYGTSVVASTRRKVISPTKHNFGSIVYSAKEDKFYEEPPYENIQVVDRIGSGDAYLGGFLFGLLKFNDLQKALEYGNAMSAVKNTVPGDMPSCTQKEMDNVIYAHKGIGPVSEMNR